jgi:hypothetical protein
MALCDTCQWRHPARECDFHVSRAGDLQYLCLTHHRSPILQSLPDGTYPEFTQCDDYQRKTPACFPFMCGDCSHAPDYPLRGSTTKFPQDPTPLWGLDYTCAQGHPVKAGWMPQPDSGGSYLSTLIRWPPVEDMCFSYLPVERLTRFARILAE